MIALRRLGTTLLTTGLAAAFFWPSAASAQIYKFVDEDGVTHFTNVPTDRRFEPDVRILEL